MWLCVLCGNMSTAHMRVFKLLWKYCHSSNLTIIIFLFFFNNSQILLFSAFWRRSRRSTYYFLRTRCLRASFAPARVAFCMLLFLWWGKWLSDNQESEWWMKKGKKDHSACIYDDEFEKRFGSSYSWFFLCLHAFKTRAFSPKNMKYLNIIALDIVLSAHAFYYLPPDERLTKNHSI